MVSVKFVLLLFLALAVIAAAIIVPLIILGGSNDDNTKASPSPTVISDITLTFVSNAIAAESKILNAGTFPEFDEHCQKISGITWHCGKVVTGPGMFRPPGFDLDKYKFISFSNEFDKFILEELKSGTNTLRTPLTRAHVEFNSVVLVPDSDDWSEGYTSDIKTKTNQKFVDDIVDNIRNNGILILGSSVLPPIETKEVFTFDTLKENAFTVTNINLNRLINAESKTSILRISFKHMDFDFKLNNVLRTVRLLIVTQQGRFGDLMLKRDEKFQFFDTKDNTFKDERPDFPSNFWERPNVGGSDITKIRNLTRELNKQFALPMPIKLTELPDWTKLKTNMLLDVLFDGTATFGTIIDETMTDDVLIKNFIIKSTGFEATLTVR